MSESLQIIEATYDARAQVESLWWAVIKHAFHQDALDDYHNPEDELRFKMGQFDAAFHDERSHYFLAFEGERLIGTIAYSTPPNRGIMKRTNHALKGMIEIGSLYIDPTLQKKGYGTQLLLFVLTHLRDQGVAEVCFDSIIETSKKIWTQMFGEPRYKVPAKKHDFVHMIWVVDVEASLKISNRCAHKCKSPR